MSEKPRHSSGQSLNAAGIGRSMGRGRAMGRPACACILSLFSQIFDPPV